MPALTIGLDIAKNVFQIHASNVTRLPQQQCASVAYPSGVPTKHTDFLVWITQKLIGFSLM